MILLVLLAVVASPAHAAGDADVPAPRVWEVNGIRLEAGQVERLAGDLAERTVDAVERSLPELDLSGEQRGRMREVYRSVALDVYGDVVEVVAREDLDDAAKEQRVRERVLEGQRRSHAELESVLDASQMTLYSAWEKEQVEAFKSRRLDDRRRRRRR